MCEISQSGVPPQTASCVSEVLKYVPAYSDSSKYDSICHISEENELCSSFSHIHDTLGAVHQYNCYCIHKLFF